MARPLLASLIAAAAFFLSAGAAGAHTGAPDARIDAVPASSAAVQALAKQPEVEIRHAGAPPATVLPILVAAAVAIGAGSSRRRLSLALALLSAVVGVDAAVHSVHHLHDPGAAASCALASGSTHAPAVLSAGVAVAVAPEPAPEGRADAATRSLALRASRPDRGRAPPFSAA